MSFAPFNFNFSLHLDPIFEWEDVETKDTSAPPPAPPPDACQDGQTEQTLPPIDMLEVTRCLVFKGYDWRPGADCVIYPSRWDRSVADEYNDAHAASIDHDSERRDTEEELRVRKARLAAAEQLDAQRLSDNEPASLDWSADPSDESES